MLWKLKLAQVEGGDASEKKRAQRGKTFYKLGGEGGGEIRISVASKSIYETHVWPLICHKVCSINLFAPSANSVDELPVLSKWGSPREKIRQAEN
jgi:hypothetical protein